PVRRFDVAAVEVPAPMLGRRSGRVFATADAADEVAAGSREPEPLVLRVTVGDCVEVALENRLPDARASFRTDLLAADPAVSAGVAAGRMPDQSVPPGAVRTYRFHASPEVGETVAVVRDGADVLGNVSRGMYGAIVVAPAGSTFHDPVDGRELGARSSWRADVRPPDAAPYRDAVLVLHDEDEAIGSHRMPYTEDVDGAVAVNYRSEPLRGRSIAAAVGDGPATPVIDAVAGDEVVLHVVAPWSQQVQVFSVEGHRWVEEPSPAGEPVPADAPRLSSRRVGGLQALTLRLEHGAGGLERLPGDYLYGNHRVPYQEAGAWGVLRVHPRAGDGLRSLKAGRGALATAALGAVALLPVALWWRRRRRAASAAAS
ncbi:MAG TPA: hypothetical protein VNU01_07585, partial [Egibacteraceae bacterium]|nr:hypothetical protein [Egibacteraceae bacterium]